MTSMVLEARIPDILLRMQERFRWTPRAERFAVVSSTRIRAGTLYRCRSRDGEGLDLALKVKASWAPETVEATYEQARSLAEASPETLGVQLVSVLGWDADPASLCMPFIEGRDLRSLLSDPAAEHRELQTLAGRCGEWLGEFHSRFAPAVNDLAILEKGSREIKRVARRLLISNGRLAAAVAHPIISREYGDFSTGNVRIGTDGSLWIFDPPSGRSFAPVLKDIAVFTVTLLPTPLVTTRWGFPRTEADESMHFLRVAFLEGYARTGPVDPRLDEWILRMYEVDRWLRVARNLWRARRAFSSMRNGVRAAATRWGLGLKERKVGK
jgi:hypothetical protein